MDLTVSGVLCAFILITGTVSPVYAQTTVTPSVWWGIKTWFEDAHEFITVNPVEKVKLKIKHAENRQIEIEKLAEKNLPIPQEFEENRLKKIEESEKIIDEQKCPQEPCGDPEPEFAKAIIENLKSAIATIRNAGELNEIRIAIADFQKLRNFECGVTEVEKTPGTSYIPQSSQSTDDFGCTVQRESLANQIDNRINNLDSVRKHCNQRISSLDLSFEDNPFKRLQEICPRLKEMTQFQARNILYGD